MASWPSTPNTVLKAYRELEHRGPRGHTVPGRGTFIEGTLGHVGLPEQAALRKSLLSWLTAAGAANLDEGGHGRPVHRRPAGFPSAVGHAAPRGGGLGYQPGLATPEVA